MVTADQVSAVLVTRGDVDLQPILETLPFRNVIVWDNSQRQDLAVYGRYAAIDEALFDVVYVQDDDVILPADSIEALLAAYEPGHVVCNMPERFRHDFYDDHALVGFGAIFDRDLPRAAEARFLAANYTLDTRHFHRTFDVVFTALTPRILVDVAYAQLPWAEDASRMYRQPNHVGERQRMLDLALQVRDQAAA